MRRDELILDRLAIGLSGLCLAHCLLTAVLLGAASALGALLGAHWMHQAGLGLAIVLGAVALTRGWARHGDRRPLVVGAFGLGLMTLGLFVPHGVPEIAATMTGVALLAGGHLLNMRAAA